MNVVLWTADASRSPSTAHAVTSFPPAWRTGVSGRNGPSTLNPVSSRNSRRAASIGLSPGSCPPFGIDQAPRSLRDQNGPPGWTSSTSRPPARRRKSSSPELCGRTVAFDALLPEFAHAANQRLREPSGGGHRRPLELVRDVVRCVDGGENRRREALLEA